MIRAIFSRPWWWTTLLVLAACAVMVRLGFWQLDRLAQRQAFNARVQAQLDQPILELTGVSLREDLFNQEYRSVRVMGEYVFSGQIALRNQVWENQFGVHLVTPLLIEGTDLAVLVNRGWIPAEDMQPGNWQKYDQTGLVVVEGMIRRSTTRPELGRRDDPVPAAGESLVLWNLLNVARINEQTDLDLLPVYIQQAPAPDQPGPPYPSLPELDLSEGSHLGYAGQWFLFALVLGIGYPIYLFRQTRARPATPAAPAGKPLTDP